MYPASLFISLILLFTTLFPTTSAWPGDTAPKAERQVLARVDVSGNIEDVGIPVYADLVDSSGQEYLLTIVPPDTLGKLKEHVTVLDADAVGKRYILARDRRTDVRSAALLKLKVLHDDGKQLIIQESPDVYPALEALSFDLARLGDHPLILPSRQQEFGAYFRAPSAYNPIINGIINAVSGDQLTSYVSGLSGVTSVTVGGETYTISTRNTNSGAPVQKATQYAYEHFQSLGLTTTYHQWSGGYLSNRNVVAEIPGDVHPEEIVLVTAHMDDMPLGAVAPGADDNASGTAAVLVAADILKGYHFSRTIRFVLFTGEEQGLYGSEAYAGSVSGHNIVAVLNMDMIAYNTIDSGPILNLHTRTTGNPGYNSDLAIASAFIDTVNTYSLPLTPAVMADGEWGSDHYSFWSNGYPAILAIEDDENDLSPYYHTVNDNLDSLNLPYFTAFVKAAIGATAQLAVVNGQLSYQLSINKDGTGTGSITPSTGTISWSGNNGTASYASNTNVDLTAQASDDSSFVGWEGACLGSPNPCSLDMTSNLAVIALFSLKTDFTGNPLTGYAPLLVNFEDFSLGNPVSWSWGFGDGETASSKDPAHIYRSPEDFTVSLTATGELGAATTIKNQYVKVAQCGNQPVSIEERGLPFPSIQAGYDALAEDEHLRIQALNFRENLILENANAVSLQGGYNCGFSTILDSTLIHGTVTVKGGPVTIGGGIVITQ
jgi:hypothetical protein